MRFVALRCCLALNWFGLLSSLLCTTVAVADDALAVALPPSDLVRSNLPYTIRIMMPANASTLTGTVRLTRHATEADAVGPVESKFSLARGGDGSARVVIDPTQLAEGEYAGQIVLEADPQIRQSFSLFRVTEGKPDRGIRYGTYAVPFRGDANSNQAIVEMLHRHGVDLIQTHINDIWRVNQPYDRAARLGIEFMPSITTIGLDADGKGLPPSDDRHIFFADGDKPKWPWACFGNPDLRTMAAGAFAKAIRGFKQHAGFSGCIYYGDDLVIPVKHAEGKTIIGCYCKTCRDGFAAVSGSQPPMTIAARSGVIPADDVYLKWMRYRVENVYGGFVKAMRDAKDGVDPALQFGLIHGASGFPFINVSRASYAPVTHYHADVVSSYTYPNHRLPRMDFIGHYEMARMNNRQKDVWMLGILGMNNTLMHDFVINQNYWSMLASGYKMIAYFGWNEYVRAMENPGKTLPHLQETIKAHMRVGQHKNWIFPAARHWSQDPARHAVLYSFTTEAIDLMPDDRGNEHQSAVLAFYREAVRQRVPMHVICEEEIRAGILAKYEAICLHGVKALPDDVHRAISAYAKAGGRVYLSECRLRIEGAQPCAMETSVALCRDAVTPAVDILDRDVIVRDFLAGDLRYYVLVNNFADRYHGLPFDYQRPEVNDAQARLLQPRQQRALSGTASFREKDRWLFDMHTGQALGKSDKPYAFALEPSWGQAIVGLPVPSATLKVSGPETASQGETAVWQAQFVDPDGRTVNGAFTINVQITNPTGRSSRYSGYFSVADGKLDIPLHLGANDATGKWTLKVEGGFPRSVVTMSLDVRAGHGMPAWVVAR